jgi:hypothetical protein
MPGGVCADFNRLNETDDDRRSFNPLPPGKVSRQVPMSSRRRTRTSSDTQPHWPDPALLSGPKGMIGARGLGRT